MFHKLTRDRDLALERSDSQAVKRCDEEIAARGGRLEYQRASQLSTSYHSTSRWVLGYLARCGWLYGIVTRNDHAPSSRKRKLQRRKLRLLEVGAINTELLNAATETITIDSKLDGQEAKIQTPADTIQKKELKYRLSVRAIDLHSCHEEIEEADFLALPFVHDDLSERYDVVVCSMVINCVTTPRDRGLMLARLYHQLRPGGLCFLTLPKLCLIQSQHITPERFQDLLAADGGIGFEIVETKESPKISFFVLRRPQQSENRWLDPKWSELTTIRKGKKFRNKFSIVLDKTFVLQEKL